MIYIEQEQVLFIFLLVLTIPPCSIVQYTGVLKKDEHPAKIA